MSAVETPERRIPARVRRFAPWIGGLILIAGIVIAILAFAPNRNSPPQVAPSPPPQPAAKPKSAPLSADAKAVARLFVKTAVARKDLAAAWKIVGPNLRGGLTYTEWLTGNIPVIPYPIESLRLAPFKIDYSHEDQALLEVALLPKPGTKAKSGIFYLKLKRIGPAGKQHWVVDSWVPRAAPMVPLGTG
jgi:hypothetical protein